MDREMEGSLRRMENSKGKGKQEQQKEHGKGLLSLALSVLLGLLLAFSSVLSMGTASLSTGCSVALLLSLALAVTNAYFRAIGSSSGGLLLSFALALSLAMLLTAVGRDNHDAQDDDQEEQSGLHCWLDRLRPEPNLK
uniref:Uncharacterized protein n=1 Tax=Anopheles melas TaxID=34690 RepID=A0A182TYA9_9DIPT